MATFWVWTLVLFFSFSAVAGDQVPKRPKASEFCQNVVVYGSTASIPGAVTHRFPSGTALFDPRTLKVEDHPALFTEVSSYIREMRKYPNALSRAASLLRYAFGGKNEDLHRLVNVVIPAGPSLPMSAENIIAAHRLSYYAYYQHRDAHPILSFESPAARGVLFMRDAKQRLASSDFVRDATLDMFEFPTPRNRLLPLLHFIEAGTAKPRYRISLSQDFAGVIRACQKMDRYQRDPKTFERIPDGQGGFKILGTSWITDEMIDAYIHVHRLGKAPSLEVWRTIEVNGQPQEVLAAGAFGLAIDGAFTWQSLYHNEELIPGTTEKIGDGAGKVAAVAFLDWLESVGYKWIDTEGVTFIPLRLGAKFVDRDSYQGLLDQAHAHPIYPQYPQTLDYQIRWDRWQKAALKAQLKEN